MADVTPILGIEKPVWDGPADIRVVNTALDVLDANAGATNASIAAAKPMTTPGDMIVGGVAGAAGRLAVGATAQVLTVVAGAPAWAAATPMTAPGDLIRGGAAGAPTRLPIGAETQALTVVGGVPAWTPPTYGGMTNPMTAPNDLIVGSTGGGAVRLGVGVAGQVLAVGVGGVGWATAPATANLLTNPGMEVWQRGVGPFASTGVYTADRWLATATTSTCSVTRIASTIGSPGFSLQATYTHVAAGSFVLSQPQEGYQQLVGKTITVRVQVKASAVGRVRAWVQDSVTGYTYSAYNTTTGDEALTATAAVAVGATSVAVGLTVDAGSCTVEVNDAVLVVGAGAPAYVPLHAAEEMDRCRRYYEVLGAGVQDEPFALGQVRNVAEIRWPVRYAEKAVTPTVAVSAPNHFGAWLADFSGATAFAALAAQNIGRQQCLMVGTATFTGFVGGNATVIHAYNTAARVLITANPP